jgi:hypothetical protein
MAGPVGRSRYLHQVRELTADATVLAADDRPDALDELPAHGPWRAHYHAPLRVEPLPPLTSTTEVTRKAVATLGLERPHLELETYTWSVLPRAKARAGVESDERLHASEVHNLLLTL